MSWLNSRRQFPKGMRVCRELQSWLAHPSYSIQKEFTSTFLREGFEESVRSITEDQAPAYDQLFALCGRLCSNQSGYEEIEVGWVDVADGDDAQVWCGGGLQGKAGMGD